MNLNICYLLLWPARTSLDTEAGQLSLVSSPKDAPYFYDFGVDVHASWGERTFMAADQDVRVRLQRVDHSTWVAECHYTLTDGLTAAGAIHKNQIHSELKRQLSKEVELIPDLPNLMEEFTILIPEVDQPIPDEWVDMHAVTLVSLMRSLSKPISHKDAVATLDSRVRFSERDMTVVDWSGAIIITEEGDFQPDIDLFKLGKFQLLRYRNLDQELQLMLADIRQLIEERQGKLFRSSNRMIRQIVQQRLRVWLDFEQIDQSLLLIGDWYSANLYQLIFDRLSLDSWKGIVREKLNSLEAIQNVVGERLVFSWNRAVDQFVFWGWVFLLIGYFVLFFIDLG